MSVAEEHGSFVMQALDLDGVSVAREDSNLVATRDLTDDQTSLEDVLELAESHGLRAEDMVVDMEGGETRLHLTGGQA